MTMDDTSQSFFSSLLDSLIEAAIIVVIAIVIQRVANKFIGKLVKRSVRAAKYEEKRDEKAREATLKSIFSTTMTVFVWFVAFLMVLAQFNVNLGPLIASAGIAGLAIGFGAQSLVKDIVNGTFILLESQYRVSDVVEINQEISGTVERFTMRVTVLRDLDGMQHYIPNGTIETATNMTMDYSGINLDMGVGYDTDLEKLEKVVNDVGQSMVDDEEWSKMINEAPKFLRVNDFADSAIMIKITGKTKPMKQWKVTGELRKRIKIAFDKNGIEIPFPQRVVHQAPKAKK